MRFVACAALCVGAPILAGAQAAVAGGLAPLAGGIGPMPPPPWRYAGLPQQKPPATRFAIESPDGRRALRVESAASYGNLVHPLDGATPGALSWRWRVERPLRSADLRTRQGDDVALKVCAMFDLPRESVPFVERQLLRLAESRVGEPLPNATLCYVWDPSWPNGSVVPNVYSRRVRYLTLGAPGPAWQVERRDLAADFLRAFGDDSTTVPALRAIAVGADADNTGGSSLGWVADLELEPAPRR